MFGKLKDILNKENQENLKDSLLSFKDKIVNQTMKKKESFDKKKIKNIQDILKELFDKIIIEYEGNFENKLLSRIQELYLQNPDDFYIDELYEKFTENENNIFNVLIEYLNKNDIELLKKIYITENYEKLSELKLNKVNQIDKLKEQIVLNNNVKSLNFTILLELFTFMEEYLKDNDHFRDKAFIYALKKLVDNDIIYHESFFDIVNRYNKNEYLVNVLEEIPILPKDIYNLFSENELIDRGSRFFLIKEYLIDKLKEKKEKLLD